MNSIKPPDRRKILMFLALALPFVVMGLTSGCVTAAVLSMREQAGNPPSEWMGFPLNRTKRDPSLLKPESKVLYKADAPKM